MRPRLEPPTPRFFNYPPLRLPHQFWRENTTYHQYNAPLSKRATVYKGQVYSETMWSNVNSENNCAGCSNFEDVALWYKVSSRNVATFPLSVNKEHLTPAADNITTFSFNKPSGIVFGWWTVLCKNAKSENITTRSHSCSIYKISSLRSPKTENFENIREILYQKYTLLSVVLTTLKLEE